MTAGTLIEYLKRRCREHDWSVNSDDVIEFAEEYVRAHEAELPTSCAVDFGSLAAHVASARGTMIGYGHGDTAAAHSLRYVQDELLKLYETAKEQPVSVGLARNAIAMSDKKYPGDHEKMAKAILNTLEIPYVD